jgi:hypothetical protein
LPEKKDLGRIASTLVIANLQSKAMVCFFKAFIREATKEMVECCNFPAKLVRTFS